ncbi:MAG: zinc ribbon domain-containing protein [Muribaculaceae bacterium]|nr:zinc ribbon domain-containing protein [Muribaculaceae bacterium]
MALIKCNVCGQMVSDTTSVCPYCGAQIGSEKMPGMSHQGQSQSSYHKKKNSLSYFLMGAIVVIGVAGGFALYKMMFNPSPSPQVTQQDTTQPVTKIDVTPNIQESLKDENADESEESESTISQEPLNSSYVMTGNIGEFPVEMRLQVYGTAVDGSYIYIGKSPNDLTLRGTLKDGQMELNERNKKGEKTGVFVGKFDSGVYSGTFKRYRDGANDKNYTFKLKVKETGN